ncbi:hypothetical protein C8J56DRAFT_915630 [Mycena floridula]|nr:hypothetical protein C8J56DRAFT_915630 [Mycena floridula]
MRLWLQLVSSSRFTVSRPNRVFSPNFHGLPSTTVRYRFARPFPHRAFSGASRPTSQYRFARPFLTSLLVAGLGLFSYGIYELYDYFFLTWPEEVRSDLRHALRAQHAGDLTLSEQLFQRAWDTAKSLPLERFDRDPLIKITGIASSLGEVNELRGDLKAASNTYVEAFNVLDNAKSTKGLTGIERHRAIQIAYKLGTIMKARKMPLEVQEEWLVVAVEEMLKLVRDAQREPELKDKILEPSRSTGPISLGDISLPSWISKVDVGAVLEALASHYKETGKTSFALPLYLQLVALMIPRQGSSAEDRCQGAEFMWSLAETIIEGSNSDENRHQAEAWATKSLSVLLGVKPQNKIPSCELGTVIAFMNLAMLKQLNGETSDAKTLYQSALDRSKKAVTDDTTKESMDHCIAQTELALEHLEESNVAAGNILDK